ncbi:MAG: lysylphosphatidylglycerol synthase domain-containing protein, partial [Halobaculum sp.]
MNRRVTVGVTLAAGAAALLAVVGPQAAVREATRLPPRRLASLAVVGTAPVVVWGVSLWLAGRGAGTRPSLGRAVAGFTALSFANVVTPFGQAGGDPPAAAVIARGFGADFETGLAAVGGLNLANRAAAVGVGLVAAVVVADSLPVPLPAVLFAGVALAALVGLVVWGRRRTVV